MKKAISVVFVFFILFSFEALGSELVEVKVVDKNFLMIHFKDGDVKFLDDASGASAYGQRGWTSVENCVVEYGDPLDIEKAVQQASWTIRSDDDTFYGRQGMIPVNCYRKSKLNGHAMFEWNQDINDRDYEHTMEHHIYLKLPGPLQQGKTYTLEIDGKTNTDRTTCSFTYDIFQSRTEAIHVNLPGYMTGPSVKAADLYIWMGSGGARDYSSFEGNAVYLYNVNTEEIFEAGHVSFWKEGGADANNFDFTKSDVWNADFTGFDREGTYRLAIEGVGCSEDFEIRDDVYREPFKVSILGFLYMRIGQDSAGITPVPRRPLWIPGVDPPDCRVLITDMHPWRDEWPGGGDRWDQPAFFAPHVLPGEPENPDAWGGHSDALDWDRRLGQSIIVWDLLFPYILTGGVLSDDDLGIPESGNGIPDLIDEARNEADFWLRLRYGKGYSQGLSNPDRNNILYQAANTPMAAWVNAINSAMLAEAFRISGHELLMHEYLDSAITAYNYANRSPDYWLERLQGFGYTRLRGRDLKMTAAAFLYNLTGDKVYENTVMELSVVTDNKSPLILHGAGEYLNQVYATAAYLMTGREINYPDLHANMKASLLYDARQSEAGYATVRPSRRSTAEQLANWQTMHNVHRSIFAHTFADNQKDKDFFLNALIQEADWGLGRNPLNIIQMTTATTSMESLRSIENCYTSGRNDGTPGLHPGHTPYLGMGDWGSSMAGSPSRLHEFSYPEGIDTWPMGELYFNTRYVYAHSEFTPQQTMSGKMALYSYLYSLSE